MTLPEGAPDSLEIAYWLQQLEDPILRAACATRYGDEVRDELLPNIAALRRQAVYLGRQKLMRTGVPDADGNLPAKFVKPSVAEVNRYLARATQMSPQAVARLVAEANQYGG